MGDLVWTRPNLMPRRRAPSVEEIVTRAILVADDEGIAAVSMRRIAADLGSGTASLYRYVTNRDELLDLMIDAVRGETAQPELTGDWRVDLTAVARNMRTGLLGHPWLVAELTGRPTLGPNSLRRHDIALGAALALTPDITTAARVVEIVNAFVFGVVAAEIAELQAQRRTGQTEEIGRAHV